MEFGGRGRRPLHGRVFSGGQKRREFGQKTSRQVENNLSSGSREPVFGSVVDRGWLNA